VLGRAYVLRAYHSVMERGEALELARASAGRALEIDDRLAEAHAVSAEIKYLFDWDWAGADRDLKRAVELDPGSDTVHLIYADFLAAMGRFDEAIAQSEKAKELDPLSPSAAHMLAFSLMGLRDYERAAAEFRAALDLNPNWTWGYIKLTKTLADSGRCDQALATAEEAEAQLHGGSTPLARAWLGYSYATCGDRERAEAALAELDRMAAAGYVDPGIYAELYAAIGTMDQVLDALERSVADRSPDAIYLPVIPDYFLPELADEPRYQALLETMNLPPHGTDRAGDR
jgi:serine/threonine-protein kinase